LTEGGGPISGTTTPSSIPSSEGHSGKKSTAVTPDELLHEASRQQDYELAYRLNKWRVQYNKLREGLSQAVDDFEFNKANVINQDILAIDTLEKFEQVYIGGFPS
jgi:hypothetical protein